MRINWLLTTQIVLTLTGLSLSLYKIIYDTKNVYFWISLFATFVFYVSPKPDLQEIYKDTNEVYDGKVYKRSIVRTKNIIQKNFVGLPGYRYGEGEDVCGPY